MTDVNNNDFSYAHVRTIDLLVVEPSQRQQQKSTAGGGAAAAAASSSSSARTAVLPCALGIFYPSSRDDEDDENGCRQQQRQKLGIRIVVPNSDSTSSEAAGAAGRVFETVVEADSLPSNFVSFSSSSATASSSATTTAASRSSALELLRSYLTEDDEVVETTDGAGSGTKPHRRRLRVAFQMEPDDSGVSAQLLEDTASGLVLSRWTAKIPPAGVAAASTAVSALVAMVGSGYRQSAAASKRLKRRIDVVEAEAEQLRGNCASWKDTAQKLEGGWQKERGQLLRNFLRLYNARTDYTKSLEEKVKRFEEQERRTLNRNGAAASQQQHPGRAAAVSGAAKRSPTSAEKRRRDKEGVPDSLELFSDDFVAKMASGQPAYESTATSASGTGGGAAAASAATTSGPSQTRKRPAAAKPPAKKRRLAAEKGTAASPTSSSSDEAGARISRENDYEDNTNGNADDNSESKALRSRIIGCLNDDDDDDISDDGSG